MVDIKRLLESINRNDVVMSRDDFHQIFIILTKHFNCRMRGMYFSLSNVYPMAFELYRGAVCVNYKALVDYYTNFVYKRLGKVDNVLINYCLVFGLIHEFIHSEQYDQNATDNEDVNHLYKICFSFVSDDSNKLKRVLNNVVYQRLHDYFATEINANVRACEYMLGIVRDSYRDCFLDYLKDYLSRCYIDYDLYDMYRNVLRLKEIDDIDFDIDIDAKIRNGIYLEDDERKLILRSRDIELSHIIDCN